MIADNGTSVTDISGGARGLMNASHIFSFPSVPGVGLNNRTTNVVGGVMLGGSSGVNGLQTHRGMRNDYDSWGSFFGDSSDWSWDGLLPYFKRVYIHTEDLRPLVRRRGLHGWQAWQFHAPDPKLVDEFDINYDASFWGNTSKVHASFPTFYWPFLSIPASSVPKGIHRTDLTIEYEMAAYGEIDGVEFPPDSGAGLPGAFWYPTSADPRTMTRSLSRPGYWDEPHQRENYETITGHKVLRILFEDEVARGVSFVSAKATDDADVRNVTARKEVILSAGAIHTPQILQSSGLGSKALLESANIGVIADLPGVGANFQDHPNGGAVTFTCESRGLGSELPEDNH